MAIVSMSIEHPRNYGYCSPILLIRLQYPLPEMHPQAMMFVVIIRPRCYYPEAGRGLCKT